MAKMFSFIKKLTDRFHTWSNPQPDKKESFQSGLYRSCRELPLDRFITCIVDGDLNALITCGHHSEADVAEAWANVYAEYIDLNADNESRYLSDLQKDISILRAEITIIDSILVCLSICYSRQLHEHLEKNYGIFVILESGNYVKNMQSLQAARSYFAPMQLELDMKEKQYIEYINSRKNETINRDYFSRMLRALARFNRVVTIRAKDITVEEFVYMIKDLIESTTKKVDYVDPGRNN